MAEEWYLLKPPYSQTSGFENDALDFSKDAFLETLDTENKFLYSHGLKRNEPDFYKAHVQNYERLI